MRWWCCIVCLQRGVACRHGRWELFCEINWLRGGGPYFLLESREREKGRTGRHTHTEKKSKAESEVWVLLRFLSLCVHKEKSCVGSDCNCLIRLQRSSFAKRKRNRKEDISLSWQGLFFIFWILFLDSGAIQSNKAWRKSWGCAFLLSTAQVLFISFLLHLSTKQTRKDPNPWWRCVIYLLKLTVDNMILFSATARRRRSRQTKISSDFDKIFHCKWFSAHLGNVGTNRLRRSSQLIRK